MQKVSGVWIPTRNMINNAQCHFFEPGKMSGIQMFPVYGCQVIGSCLWSKKSNQMILPSRISASPVLGLNKLLNSWNWRENLNG